MRMTVGQLRVLEEHCRGHKESTEIELHTTFNTGGLVMMDIVHCTIKVYPDEALTWKVLAKSDHSREINKGKGYYREA